MPIQLGAAATHLTVYLPPPDYPWACTLLRTDAATGAPVDWSTPPVLTFSDDSTWVAALTGNAAAFTASGVEVGRVRALPDPTVRLTLGGYLWACGAIA